MLDWWLRRESNPDLEFRKPLFYPLNYGAEHLRSSIRHGCGGASGFPFTSGLCAVASSPLARKA